MDKFKEIRPVALGVAIKDNKILVGNGFDKVKNEKFYRCLGGGIEFLEKGEDALKREFWEEIGINIAVKDVLGISENIFHYNGKDAHELILFYSVDINNDDFKDYYNVLDGDVGDIAEWIDIDLFKSNTKILYPKDVLRFI